MLKGYTCFTLEHRAGILSTCENKLEPNIEPAEW